MPVILVSFVSFELIKVSIIGTFWFFVRKLKFVKYSFQKPVKKNCGRPVFVEELQAARNFTKVFLHSNKIPNSLRQVLQAFSEICIFVCATKKLLQKQWTKIDPRVPGESCDKIDDDVTKFIL